MLLDQRLLEGHGDAIAADRCRSGRSGRCRSSSHLVCAPSPLTAAPQNHEPGDSARAIAAFATRLARSARTADRPGARPRRVLRRARPQSAARSTRRMSFGACRSASPMGAGARGRIPKRTRGTRRSAPRAAEIIRRTHEFHREVLAIFASVEPSSATWCARRRGRAISQPS